MAGLGGGQPLHRAGGGRRPVRRPDPGRARRQGGGLRPGRRHLRRLRAGEDRHRVPRPSAPRRASSTSAGSTSTRPCCGTSSTALQTSNAPLDPDDPEVTVGLARLRRDCVEAKEALSTDVDTLVPVALPGLSTTVRITRAEFEAMIRPALAETIAATHPGPPLRAGRAVAAAQHPAGRRQLPDPAGQRDAAPRVLRAHRPGHPPEARRRARIGARRAGRDRRPRCGARRGGTAGPTRPPDRRAEPTSFPAPRPRRCPRRHTSPLRLPDPADAPTAPLPVAGTAPVPAAGRRRWPPRHRRPAGRPAPPGAPPAACRPPKRPATAPRRSGRVRVLAVVLAAVLLGVGAGVFIALRDRATVASPPVTSAPPSSPPSSAPVSPSVTTPTPAPSATPTPSSAGPVRRAARVRAAGRRGHRLAPRPRRQLGHRPAGPADASKETRLTTGRGGRRGTGHLPKPAHDHLHPDGRRPADVTGDGGGRHRRPAPVRPSRRRAASGLPGRRWSRSGRFVVTCNTEDAISVRRGCS